MGTVGKIVGMAVDGTYLPRGETVDWTVGKECTITLGIRNIGDTVGAFSMWIEDENEAVQCFKTTPQIPVGSALAVECGSFIPDIAKRKTLVAHVIP